MSKTSKISLLLAGILLVVSYTASFILGTWLNLNSVLIAIAGGLVVMAMGLERRTIWEFLTMRTTKHGMNMGAMIVLVLSALICVNYLANRHNKVWDFTQEKQYSLSEQSESLMKGLKSDMKVTVFYKGQPAQEEKFRIKSVLELYTDRTSHLRAEFVNAYVDQLRAAEALKEVQDIEAVLTVTFVEYGGRKVRVEFPYQEAEFTSAMIKATRETSAKVYFVRGHGERALDADEAPGIKEMNDVLVESGFKVESISLLDTKEIPADASVLVIMGPTIPYLEDELAAVRRYVERGGKLLLALDPGQRHNLAGLTKSLGVQFENNYVITRATIQGGGPVTVLGQRYDSTSNVTKSVPEGATSVFNLVSEVQAAPDKAADLEIYDLVKSHQMSFTVNDISKPVEAPDKMRAVVLAVEVKGKAVIFGDSDFASNQFFQMGVNRELGLNAVASLANQTDLLSIKPKMPKGTSLILTTYGQIALLIFGFGMPLLLLITAGVLWFRRRGA